MTQHPSQKPMFDALVAEALAKDRRLHPHVWRRVDALDLGAPMGSAGHLPREVAEMFGRAFVAGIEVGTALAEQGETDGAP